MRHALPTCVITAMMLCIFALPAPEALADKASAESTLASKGLKKSGSHFVLDGEVELAKNVAAARRSKSLMDAGVRSVRKEESKIRRIKDYIAGKQFEARKYFKQLSEPNLPAARNNQIVAKLELIEGELSDIEKGPLKKQQAKFDSVNGKYIKARDDYIGMVLRTQEEAKILAKQYKDLAADAAVTAAVKEIAEADGKKYLLGPSSVFRAQNAVSATMARQIISENVEIRVENDIPWVELIINGKQRRSMVLDSGASMVSLPHDVAEGLGLTPSTDTPVIRLQLADGKIVEAWLMEIQSMQLGPFKVEKVECAVLPKELIAAQPLLGATFLKHFVYKLDLQNKKIDMARVKGH